MIVRPSTKVAAALLIGGAVGSAAFGLQRLSQGPDLKIDRKLASLDLGVGQIAAGLLLAIPRKPRRTDPAEVHL